MLRLAACVVVLSLTAFSANAQSLIDRFSEGMGKAAEAVDRSVRSTVDLVTDEATPEETRAELDAMAAATLDRLFADNPEAQTLFEESAGYAVFDSRRLSLGISAGYGRGVAVNRLTETRDYMNMGTGGFGVSIGFGGYEQQMVALFETEPLFEDFVRNGYDATAETGAMFGDVDTDQRVRFVDGRTVFVLTKKGWKLAASVAGTKYWRDADLN